MFITFYVDRFLNVTHWAFNLSYIKYILGMNLLVYVQLHGVI